MCLGIPMKIRKISKNIATAQADGLSREINISFLRNTRIGDYVIVHAGFAIEKVNEKKANETLGLFKEMKNEIFR